MSSTTPPPKVKKPDPLLGSTVAGKFKVLSLVAAGGMGRVYRAEQVPLGRAVALKVLHVDDDTDESESSDRQFKKRFLREASILSKLQHPNIVTVFDYGEIDGDGERYFMAMEFLSGHTLARRISDQGFLSPRDTIKIGRQIARGFTEAHGAGVIHRDLKPSNVMLVAGRDGEDLVKIVDFGILKVIGEDSADHEELTQEGSFIGSPKYMAPEQITRGGKIDTRTDIYSFGIILYQCITGSVPFDGDSSVQTLMAHLNQRPQPMRERVPTLEIPDWLDELVMSCIEKDPERRPQTMESVARGLGDAEAAMNSGRMVASVSAQRITAPKGLSPHAWQDSLAASGSGANPSITTQGTISSVEPRHPEDKTRASPGVTGTPKAQGRRSRVPHFMTALVFLTLGVGTIVALLPRAPVESAASLPLPPPPPAANLPPPAIVPPAPFALTIESIPGGAEVREGDRPLGTTPLVLSIDNDSVRASPRAFTVAKDGYAPYALAQGPSQTGVRLVAPLTALSDAGARPRRHVAPPSHAAPAASTARPDLDIRLHR